MVRGVGIGLRWALVGDLFGLSATSLARDIFPDSAAVTPLKGLVNSA